MPPISRRSARPGVPRTGTASGRSPRLSRRRAAPAAIAFGLLATCLAMPSAQAADPQPADPPPVTVGNGPIFTHLPAPLSTSDCQARYAISCYTPAQLHSAYHLDPLYRRRIDGRGVTIVVAVPFGSPTIRNDLEVFDRQFGLRDPKLRIVQFGTIPPYDPQDLTRVEWAAGTTLQVEYAHAIAPGADIVIAETAVAETRGVTGFPELTQAMDTLIHAGVGDVFAQIEGTAENTFPGFDQGDNSSLLSLRQAYRSALAHHVTMLAAAGSTGVVNRGLDGTRFTFPTVRWPASDPLVTAVGASQQYLDDAGRVLRPTTAWKDPFGASGGGVSAVFPRPAYQSRVRGTVGGHRGAPDISMNGSVDGSVWVYASFGGTGGTGWDLYNGTAEAMSTFSGIVALADQAAGHRLGFINPALYRLAERARHGDRSTGLVDITEGSNTFAGVTGYAAGRGYDLVTGLGTIDGAAFVPALARAR